VEKGEDMTVAKPKKEENQKGKKEDYVVMVQTDVECRDRNRCRTR
jgi:hypothetical protein